MVLPVGRGDLHDGEANFVQRPGVKIVRDALGVGNDLSCRPGIFLESRHCGRSDHNRAKGLSERTAGTTPRCRRQLALANLPALHLSPVQFVPQGLHQPDHSTSPRIGSSSIAGRLQRPWGLKFLRPQANRSFCHAPHRRGRCRPAPGYLPSMSSSSMARLASASRPGQSTPGRLPAETESGCVARPAPCDAESNDSGCSLCAPRTQRSR